MARAKETMPIVLVKTSGTGALDTGAHTVEVYPVDNTYPTGKITCTQLSDGYTYIPDSDLNEDDHYNVRVDGEDVDVKYSLKSRPVVGL